MERRHGVGKWWAAAFENEAWQELGRSQSRNETVANNWIRGGDIRSRTKNGGILYENNYGY